MKSKILFLVFSLCVSLSAEVVTTRGIVDFKRPKAAVQLVGDKGHVMIAENNKVKNRWVFKDGILTASPLWDSVITPELYNDFRMHVEFNTNDAGDVPPEKNGNSGVYIQQRYEVQITNAYGIAAKDFTKRLCASLYKQKIPDQLVCKAPGEWQTYDIVFRAARFVDGKRTEQARITVYHNEVLIHDDYAFPRQTGAGKQEGPEPGPIKLQGHKNEVRYRNVWIQALDLSKPYRKSKPWLDRRR